MDSSLESADIKVDLRNNNINSISGSSNTSGTAVTGSGLTSITPSDKGIVRSRQHHCHQHQPVYQQQQHQTRFNQPKEGSSNLSGEASTSDNIGPIQSPTLESAQNTQPGMAYQHKHALHRLRRLKKRSPHRDLVISFVPRLRTSIINRLDFFYRYSKQEQEVLSCFDFLDELVSNYCDGGLQESPRCSQKLYQSMIYELI